MIETIEQLEALYGTPKAPSLVKVADHINAEYGAYIKAAPFCALATVGPEGLDCTPRGDNGQVVFIEDDKTLSMPDWRGNDRLDTLRNIVRDPRLSLMFLVPGSQTIVRVYCASGVAKPVEQIIQKYNQAFQTKIEIVRTGGSGELMGQIKTEFATELVGGADLYITADDQMLAKAHDEGVHDAAAAAGDEHLQQCVTADHQVFYPVEYNNRADIPAQVEYTE